MTTINYLGKKIPFDIAKAQSYLAPAVASGKKSWSQLEDELLKVRVPEINYRLDDWEIETDSIKLEDFRSLFFDCCKAAYDNMADEKGEK